MVVINIMKVIIKNIKINFIIIIFVIFLIIIMIIIIIIHRKKSCLSVEFGVGFVAFFW